MTLNRTSTRTAHRLVLALLVASTSAAQADIITFNALVGAGNNPIGPIYNEGGYTLTTNVSNGGFWAVNPGAPNGRYTGSTSIFSNPSSGVITLQRADGQAFNLTSIALAELNQGSPGFNITFTGTRYYGGSTLTQNAFVNGGAVNPQTAFFGSFSAVSSVSWQQLSPYHQFDNIVLEAASLEAASLAPPTTVFAGSHYNVRNGGNGDPTGDILQNGVALVGNGNTPSGPDYRGFAKFVLDRPELVTATTAVLSLTPFIGNLTGHLDIVLEAILTPIGASPQPSDFQANPIGWLVFNTSTLTLNQPTTFDVTSFYNLAIQNDQNLTFRVRQLNETGDSRPLNWGFTNFQLALDYTVSEPDPDITAVPEPASLALLGLSLLGFGGLRWRQREKRNNAEAIA